MRAVYLTGETLYLRAFQESDRECGVAWRPSPFPTPAERAEAVLAEMHTTLFHPRYVNLAIARQDDDAVVGSVRVSLNQRHVFLQFHVAPWVSNSDEVQAEALQIVTRWVLDEYEPLLIDVSIPEDESATMAAAEALDMRQCVRLREQVVRPGYRVDLCVYQWAHPSMEESHA